MHKNALFLFKNRPALWAPKMMSSKCRNKNYSGSKPPLSEILVAP